MAVGSKGLLCPWQSGPTLTVFDINILTRLGYIDAHSGSLRIWPGKRPSWPECSRSQALASGRVGDFQAESLAAPELARAAAPPTGPPGSRDAVLKSPKADPRQSPVVLKPVAKRKILINGLVVLKGRYLGIQGDDLPDLLLVGEYVAELFLSRRSWTPFDKVCDR
jgi:hypothetical protein